MVRTDTVTAQGAAVVDPERGGGDFYLATSGDLTWPPPGTSLATNGDFRMATDNSLRALLTHDGRLDKQGP